MTIRQNHHYLHQTIDDTHHVHRQNSMVRQKHLKKRIDGISMHSMKGYETLNNTPSVRLIKGLLGSGRSIEKSKKKLKGTEIICNNM
uniref:Putative ovule protein n=1 Tax=Solanum chacoense TaxID=4108 RepID=A0A0V0HIP7_SOLCH